MTLPIYTLLDPNHSPFKIDGIYCRLISLTRGQLAIVAADDYSWLSQWPWFARYAKSSNCFYASRWTVNNKGQKFLLDMHRQILGLTYKDKKIGDHIYPGHTLDNRRNNLRVATPSQSSANIRRSKANRVGIKGIGWNKRREMYRVRIKFQGKEILLGHTLDLEEGGRWYAEAALKYFGEFGRSK